MRRPGWLSPLIVDVLLAVAALADGLLYLYRAPGIEVALAVAAAAGVLLRRRWPWVSLLLALPAMVVSSASLAALVALYSIAATERRRWRIAVAAFAVFGATAPSWWGDLLPGDTIGSLLYAAMTTAAPIALGLLVQTRRELSARLRDLEEARESERRRAEQETLATERARIAREMHDVVSHQVSLLAVQAGALQVAAPDPDVRATARTMRSLAVRTLDELRQMVTVLRVAGSTGQLAPQPTIEDLPALIEDSGITAITAIDLPTGLSASAQRAIYRTIQEGLTNIRKHAPGSTATITARSEGAEIAVSVANTAGTEPAMGLPSAGHGLVGLRERAELLGGSLTLRRDAADGHTLTLRVPRS